VRGTASLRGARESAAPTQSSPAAGLLYTVTVTGGHAFPRNLGFREGKAVIRNLEKASSARCRRVSSPLMGEE